jgi:hypothetical protein
MVMSMVESLSRRRRSTEVEGLLPESSKPSTPGTSQLGGVLVDVVSVRSVVAAPSAATSVVSVLERRTSPPSPCSTLVDVVVSVRAGVLPQAGRTQSTARVRSFFIMGIYFR